MPIVPFEVDSVTDFVPKSHAQTLDTLELNKSPNEPNQLTSKEPGPVWTVSDLTRSVRLILEGRFRSLVVEGELSNVHQANSGHWYFVIKDEHSQLRAILFKQTAMRLNFVPEEGMAVWVRGALQVFEQRGEYQINVTGLEPQGAGALKMAYPELYTGHHCPRVLEWPRVIDVCDPVLVDFHLKHGALLGPSLPLHV